MVKYIQSLLPGLKLFKANRTMTIPTLVLFTILWLVWSSPCNGLHASLDKYHLGTSSTMAPYWYSMMKNLQFIGNSLEHREWLPQDHINDIDDQVYNPLLTGSGIWQV
ncbi:uncharacterized protein LOC143233847 [Tachypleus tridentatus]|uniref:uncharacterized protein LOC143233847 n=1 Tax=Tachypleus tridentatus TaxID=6853 RepID=UPI003FD2F933